MLAVDAVGVDPEGVDRVVWVVGALGPELQLTNDILAMAAAAERPSRLRATAFNIPHKLYGGHGFGSISGWRPHFGG
jgi:hypothetical protein